jgi:ribosomal protein S12 methylthiotransferase
LRGDLVSRPAAEVLREAEKLVAAGVKEILVISQDTGAYGLDLKYSESLFHERPVRAKLIDLARELGQLGVWVRLHYVYPYPHIDDVIGLMEEGTILPYLDIPFQHASPKILRAMRRPGDSEKMLERISKWRAACPEIALRSTFIVGFPGETEEDFEALLDWLTEAKIDRAGAFKYEPVAGAAANDLGLPFVPPEVQDIRYRHFMEHCQKVSARKLKEKIGKRLQVIVDQGGPRGGIGRTKGDAPGIDGKVHIASKRPLRQGDIVTVKIERADEYDLFGAAS